MTSIENDYQNKHSKGIHLDAYRGVACDLMDLNAPIADGFMRVSDMRSDVVIIRKPEERVRDYDEIGFVRVGKFLKLPRLNFWHNGNGLVQTRKEDDVWYIAVNDQDLADRVARIEGSSKKFDERFVDSFRTEVNHGLLSCLKREKLLNGGNYDLGFFNSYHGFLSYDIVLGCTTLAIAILTRDIESIARVLAATVIANTATNILNIVGVGMTYVEEKYLHSIIPPRTPHFDDPFVRRSLLEFVMPPVPVDRVIRESKYLGNHGGELITYNNTVKR